MISQTWWYVARSTGMVAWLLLSASVIWGIILATKAFPKRRRPAWLLDLHRWLGALTLAFVAVHIAAILADSYTPIGWVDVVVPFASPWRPVAVAAGVIALWALLAVELSSLAMRRIPRRTWRTIHMASYGVFVLGTLHAVLAGSDSSSMLYEVTGLAALVAVGWAVTYRLTQPSVRGGANRQVRADIGVGPRSSPPHLPRSSPPHLPRSSPPHLPRSSPPRVP